MTRLRFILAVLSALGATLTADAQCRTYRPAYYHETPVIAVPLVQAVPVLVPAFSFQYQQQPTVGGFMPQTPSFSPQAFPQHYPQQFQGQQQFQPTGFAQWQPQQAQMYAPTVAGPTPAGGDLPIAVESNEVGLAYEANVLTTQAVGILKQHCASCHSGQGKSGVSFFDANGGLALTVGRDEIAKAANLGLDGLPKMPPAARSDPYKILSETERRILSQWAARSGVASR